jgi:hypothetical protein
MATSPTTAAPHANPSPQYQHQHHQHHQQQGWNSSAAPPPSLPPVLPPHHPHQHQHQHQHHHHQHQHQERGAVKMEMGGQDARVEMATLPPMMTGPSGPGPRPSQGCAPSSGSPTAGVSGKSKSQERISIANII